MKEVIQLIDTYPFGTAKTYPTNQSNIVVRERIFTSANQIKQRTFKKIQFLKSALPEHIIKLYSVQEHRQELILNYEYVPILLEPWISNINSSFIQSIKVQLGRVTNFLAENHIITRITINKLGMNEKYQVKFFLGTDFQFNQQLSAKIIKFNYMNNIMDVFAPYLYGQKSKLVKTSMIKQTPKNSHEYSHPLQQSHITPSHQDHIDENGIKSILLKYKKPQKKANMATFLKKIKDFQEQNEIKRDKLGNKKLGTSLIDKQSSKSLEEETLTPQKLNKAKQLKTSLPNFLKSSDEYHQFIISPRYKHTDFIKKGCKTKRDDSPPSFHPQQDHQKPKIYNLKNVDDQKYKMEIKSRVQKAINNSINAINKYKIYTNFDEKDSTKL